MADGERNAADTSYECDALVVGSAAGMSAAVTAGHCGLNVLIVEKEPCFGGTSARSGGWLWIPGTSLARAWGIVESPDQARTYLRHEAGNSFDEARVNAFLKAGPEAIDFFISQTSLHFDMPLVFPDYHAEAPGGTQGGRSMVTRPFDGRELGPHVRNLGAPLPELTLFGMMLGSGKEIIHFMRATKSPTSAIYVAKRLSRHLMDVMRYGRGMTLTNGNALAGRLAKSAFDLKIPLWLSSPVRDLQASRHRQGRVDPGGESNPRFIVTSLMRAEAAARHLYEDIYCARGDMENRIKECQLDLYADRTSAATMRANQLRLWFASMAYVLICALRRIGLTKTVFANATCGTIRLKLLKIGALIRISVRRVRIAMTSACPAADDWARAARRLADAAKARASPV